SRVGQVGCDEDRAATERFHLVLSGSEASLTARNQPDRDTAPAAPTRRSASHPCRSSGDYDHSLVNSVCTHINSCCKKRTRYRGWLSVSHLITHAWSCRQVS